MSAPDSEPVLLTFLSILRFYDSDDRVVVASRSHALSYYDHPPLAFALARLMADLSGGENAAILRLPFLAMGTASTILLYDITRRSFGGRAAFWASAAFACALGKPNFQSETFRQERDNHINVQ